MRKRRSSCRIMGWTPARTVLRIAPRSVTRRPRGKPRWRSSRTARRQTRRSEEHTSELQSLMRISYAVFCLKKKKIDTHKRLEQYISIQINDSTAEDHKTIYSSDR